MAKKLTIQELTGLNSYQHAEFVIEYCKDWDARRAAETVGYAPEYGHRLLENDNIKEAINAVLRKRAERAEIDAEWLLQELVDNHYIARHKGKLNISNQALGLIARHAAVDAFAAEKVMVQTDEKVKERLLRARSRAPGHQDQDAEVSFF